MEYQIIVTDSGFPDHGPENTVLAEVGGVRKVQWADEDELISNVRLADALLVQWAPITKRVIDALDSCRIIVRYGIGYDNIDLVAAAAKGIVVCNVPDYCVEEVADHTLALALAALRQIPETDRNIRNGHWSILLPRPVAPFSQLVFCLAGFGRIAREVARRAMGVGFRVGAYDPFVSAQTMRDFGVEPLTREELFASADVLSLHLPLNAETKHVINQNSLQSMKRGALIVNTSRGGLVHAEALAAGISTGEIWGAALDVFEDEPLPQNHVLRETAGVILSSHVAWYSSLSVPKLQTKAAEEVLRFLTGQAVANRVG